jgi:excisionase family DNA binding protein
MKRQQQVRTQSGEPLQAYTPKYVAAAVSVHEETIRGALRSGRLPGVRIGTQWRITHATLLALLRNGLPTKES